MPAAESKYANMPDEEDQNSEDWPEKIPFQIKVILCFRRCIFFHPIILSHFLTVSFLLSLYSTLQCDFLIIEIGFQPLNDYVESHTLSLCPLVGEYRGGCYLYSNDFKKTYIDNDENWFYARIGSIISMGSGFMCFVSIEARTSNHCPVTVTSLYFELQSNSLN